MTAADKIVVVGGGIGGVSAAVALAKRGMEVTVLERAPEIKEIGAGLQLGPNAGRVLQDLGVMDAVLRTAVLPHRFVLRDIYTGNEIYQATMGKEFVQRYGAPYTVIHRADLLDALLEVALATGNVEVVTGKEVVAVEQTDTAAHVQCADGSTYRGDAVIGADGLRSAVRRLTLDDSEPIRSEYVIYRGPGPRPEGTEDAVMLFAGDEIHLMQYPVQGGELLNRVLSFRSRTAAPGSEEWATREELFERFANTCDHIKESLHTLDLETRWVQFDRKPMAGWRTAASPCSAMPRTRCGSTSRRAPVRPWRTRSCSPTLWETAPRTSRPPSRSTRRSATRAPTRCRRTPGSSARWSTSAAPVPSCATPTSARSPTTTTPWPSGSTAPTASHRRGCPATWTSTPRAESG